MKLLLKASSKRKINISKRSPPSNNTPNKPPKPTPQKSSNLRRSFQKLTRWFRTCRMRRSTSSYNSKKSLKRKNLNKSRRWLKCKKLLWSCSSRSNQVSLLIRSCLISKHWRVSWRSWRSSSRVRDTSLKLRCVILTSNSVKKKRILFRRSSLSNKKTLTWSRRNSLSEKKTLT